MQIVKGNADRESVDRRGEPLLTLEPLVSAVREGVELGGWDLSGLQKTTSHQYEGRWEGESARSAYLFFHSERRPEWASVEAFLDETSRGLRGNLALVLDGPKWDEGGDAGALLSLLGSAARATLLEGYERPVTLRLVLADADAQPQGAETQYRFKIKIPPLAFDAGRSAVVALSAAAARAFEALLEHSSLRPHLPPDRG